MGFGQVPAWNVLPSLLPAGKHSVLVIIIKIAVNSKFNWLAPINNEEGSIRDVVAYITIAAALLIGAYILGMFIDVMPELNATNPFHSVMESISAVIGSGYGILVIVLIVIAFVIILGYLMRIGRD